MQTLRGSSPIKLNSTIVGNISLNRTTECCFVYLKKSQNKTKIKTKTKTIENHFKN